MIAVIVLGIGMGCLYGPGGNQGPEKQGEGTVMTEQLWELKDPNDFVVTLMEHLEQKTQYGRDMSALRPAERVVYITQSLEMEVNNGGFSQYFYNSSGDHANELVSAFQAIGEDRTAGICRKALAAFGRELPADRSEREKMLDAVFDDAISGILDACDRAFYACEDDLAELTYRYVLKNKEQFIEPCVIK